MSHRGLFAAVSVALSAVFTAIGTFREDDHSEGWEWSWTWLVVVAIIVAAAGIVFWIIVPRIERLERGALILAIVGAVSIAVFWSGLPSVLAGAAALLAITARERGEGGGAGVAALVVAALTVAAAAVVAFLG